MEQHVEAYNLTNLGGFVSIAEFANIIAKFANKKIIHMEASEKDIVIRSPIEKQVLSSKKMENLGWKSMFSVDEGVNHTLSI